MNLPQSNILPIDKLATVFNKKVATYKFYWFLALIELVEEGNIVIPKKKIFGRMISHSWYIVNYFHVSFGKQDKVEIAVESILNLEPKLTIDSERYFINKVLDETIQKDTIQQLMHFDKNVPHWFLSPWFPKQNKSSIYQKSTYFENDSLYALYKEHIELNPIWVDYLKSNAKIIKDFCYWNLTLFLQVRNPNVPDIPNKLIKPATRASLIKQTNQYWKLVFQELGSIDCIFTNTKLHFDPKNFALDHFIPHAFVSHDLIWNLLPIESRFNSIKSDKLPIFNQHFDKFFELQKVAFEINKHHNAKSKFMEEYLTIFPNINHFDKVKFSETIQPLITIASNNGFPYLYDNI